MSNAAVLARAAAPTPRRPHRDPISHRLSALAGSGHLARPRRRSVEIRGTYSLDRAGSRTTPYRRPRTAKR